MRLSFATRVLFKFGMSLNASVFDIIRSKEKRL
jgi:hypothetical protein